MGDGTVKPLPIGYKNLLRVLKIFADYCQDKGMPIEDWTAVTKGDFDKFRTSRAGLALSEKSDAFSISTPITIIAPTPSFPAPKQKDLLFEFKKGIKWDASLFVVLKDLKQWDSWHCSTVAQACVQDVYDMLDPSTSLYLWKRTSLKPNRDTCMLSLRGYCKQIKARCWSD